MPFLCKPYVLDPSEGVSSYGHRVWARTAFWCADPKRARTEIDVLSNMKKKDFKTTVLMSDAKSELFPDHDTQSVTKWKYSESCKHLTLGAAIDSGFMSWAPEPAVQYTHTETKGDLNLEVADYMMVSMLANQVLVDSRSHYHSYFYAA